MTDTREMRTIGSTSEVIGTAVRSRRKQLKLTQHDLAAVAGVSQKFLSELELGKATVRLDAVERVLVALGLEIVVK